jgi:ribose transport system substrate-binding protein
MLSRRAALTLPLLLSGCNRSTKKRIAVIPKGRAHIFWQSVHAGAIAASRENGIDIIWNGPTGETDFNGQIQIVEAMINQHVDAICLAPIDRDAMVGVVERAAKQNIPVVIWDSPVNTQNFVAQVATDNYAAGQLAAARVAELLGGKGEVAIVAVQVGAASTMAREQGFEDGIKKNSPGITIVDKRYGNADFAQSLAVAENLLTAHPKLNALFASNESSSVGASQALKSRHSKVKMVGFDSSPALIDDVKSGVIDALIVQDPFKMGFEAVKAAVDKINGGTPQKINNLPPAVVTKNNLSDPEIDKRLHPDLDKYLKS